MKKSCTIFVLAVLQASTALLAENWGKYKTKEEAIEGHRKLVEKVGGMVERPAEGPSVLFVNEQRLLADDAVAGAIGDLTKKMRLRNIVVSGTGLPQPSVLWTNYLADSEIAAAIAVCDMTNAPALTVYPELRAAVVNMAALVSDDKALMGERLRKEIWRAFGFVFGGGYTVAYPKAALRPIGSLAELDRTDCVALSIDSMQTINKIMERWGMTPVKKTSYKRAVEEGWAPAPTNDIQRAIWDAARAAKMSGGAEKPGVDKSVAE